MATNKNAKSAPAAAKSAKGAKAAPAATTGATVGKLDKNAKAAARAEISKKAGNAAGQSGQGQSKPRGQFAGKTIKVLVKPEDSKLRGDRLPRFELVAKANGKSTDTVIGQSYKRGDGETATFVSGNLAPFVEKGLISLS